MGGTISALAFPAPSCGLEYYEDDLLRRPDLISLTTSQNEKIPAVHIEHPPRAAGERERLTIIYSHGNAEDIGLHLPLIDALAAVTGCDVLSYEYVGYCLSRLQAGSQAMTAWLRVIGLSILTELACDF